MLKEIEEAHNFKSDCQANPDPSHHVVELDKLVAIWTARQKMSCGTLECSEPIKSVRVILLEELRCLADRMS